MINNLTYQKIIESYAHLKGVETTDCDPKPYLPIHLILEASEYTGIKTSELRRVGLLVQGNQQQKRPSWGGLLCHRELRLTTRICCGQKRVMWIMQNFVGQTSQVLEDTPEHDQRTVYAEFREQLARHLERWYETSLPWKGNHLPLPNNKAIDASAWM